MSQIVIDFPFPISVNKIWRGSGRHVYRSKEYISWIKEASIQWIIQKKDNKIKRIAGNYALTIVLSPPHKRLIDLGNFEKAVSDILQRLDIIDDDHFCRRLLMTYAAEPSEAPLGARVTLEHHP